MFGNPVYRQILQRGGAEPSEVQAAVAAVMREEHRGEPAVVSMQAIVFDAHKA